MGATAALLRIPQKVLARIAEDPPLFDRLPWWGPDEACPFEGLPEPLGLGKDWHLLHYLLTGDVWSGEEPLSWVVLEGDWFEEGETEVPGKTLDSEDVTQVAAALEAISEGEILSRWPPEESARDELTCFGSYDDREREALLELVQDVRLYYRSAAEAGQGMALLLAA